MTFKLITNGDSWTFGSEIVDPVLVNKHPDKKHVTEYDFFEENDGYRITKIWPTHLASIMNADLINLAWPADDNGSILRRTLSYVTTNFIEKNLPTANILVIIGWSSPERNSFWYDDGKQSHSLRLYPTIPSSVRDVEFKKFWEYYVTNLWNPEDYIRRFIFDAVQFENFCLRYKIKYLQFNSFYQTPDRSITQWKDLNIPEEVNKLKPDVSTIYDSTNAQRKHEISNYMPLWNTLNSVNFYNKDQINNTFKGFIDSKFKDPYNKSWHPSPESHLAWAKELHRYLTVNKIIN